MKKKFLGRTVIFPRSKVLLSHGKSMVSFSFAWFMKANCAYYISSSGQTPLQNCNTESHLSPAMGGLLSAQFLLCIILILSLRCFPILNI